MAYFARISSLPNCGRSLLQTMMRRPAVRLQSTDAVKEKAAKIEYTPPKKTWVSYGFSRYSEELDRHGLHVTFFMSVTLCIIVGGYLFTYAPDIQYRDWAQREAYLQLRRREELGLDPIDPNFIDPARINLPSDEELGDFVIKI